MRVSCSAFIIHKAHSGIIVHILQCAHKKLYGANLKTDFVNVRKCLSQNIVHHQLNGQYKVHISMFLLGTHNLDDILRKGQLTYWSHMLTKYFLLHKGILAPSLRLALTMLREQPKINSVNRTERSLTAFLRESSASSKIYLWVCRFSRE